MSRARPRILVVEDEALLAMDIAAVVEEAGCDVVGEAASLSEVAALSESLEIEGALVDVQLLHGSSGIDAACLLRQLYPDVRILFVTANVRSVPADFEGAIGILPKPFNHVGLSSAVQYLVGLIEGRSANDDQPHAVTPLRHAEPY